MMIKNRIYVKTYLKVSDYYYVRKTIKGRQIFYKDNRAQKFPHDSLDLFISYRLTESGKKLFFVAEGGTGLRVTPYSPSKVKTLKKARDIINSKTLFQITQQIIKKNRILVSPRYCKIVKGVKDVATSKH